MAFLTKVIIIKAKTYHALGTKLNEAIRNLDVIDIKFPESMIYTAVVHFKTRSCNKSVRNRAYRRRIESAE